MNFIFLMDPLQKVIMEKDTSFILMLGAYRRGHKVFYVGNDGLTRRNGETLFHATPVIPQQVKENPFIRHEEQVLTESEVDAVFIRTDPPFEYEYLMNTWTLDLLPKRIPVLNSPSGIRTTNEKIWATQFDGLVPRTLISRRIADLLKFLKDEHEVIAKPTYGFGGQSVFKIKTGDVNANVILETLTDHGTKDIILQQYIAEAADGDKRILLLNGDPLGAVLRVHSADDHRNNFFSGGVPKAAKITARDQEIIDVLRPHLRKLGLYFVGIDVIGKYLIEVNVTSPTCLQEMNRLYDQTLENTVIEFAEKLVEDRRANAKMSF